MVLSLKGKERFEWLDCWRIVSAIAIIWLHTPQSEELRTATNFTRYAVPFFAASAGFMACRIHAFKESIPSFLRSRFLRIYVPFLGWSFIYIAIRWAASLVMPGTRAYQFTTELFWQGPTSHLWFLPFIFFATIFAHLLGRLLNQCPGLTWPIAVSLLVGSLAILANPEASTVLTYTARLSYHTLPALFWGITLSIVCSRLGKEWLSSSLTVAIAFAVFLGLEIALVMGDRNQSIQNMAGFFLLLSCFAGNSFSWVSAVASVGSLAYGVYLSHILFIEGFQDLAEFASFPTNAVNDLVVFLLSAVCSLALTMYMHKSSRLRWLVP